MQNFPTVLSAPRGYAGPFLLKSGAFHLTFMIAGVWLPDGSHTIQFARDHSWNRFLDICRSGARSRCFACERKRLRSYRFSNPHAKLPAPEPLSCR